MQPKDEDEFVDMLWTMAHYNAGPIAIRYPRGAERRANQTGTETLEIGKAEVVRHGTRVAIFGSAKCLRWRKKPRANLKDKASAWR